MDSHIYQRAECFLPWNLQNNVFNTTIFPYLVDAIKRLVKNA